LGRKVDYRLGKLPVDHLGQLSIELGNDDQTSSNERDSDRDIKFALRKVRRLVNDVGRDDE
jgi:hypothetical protein